jgi:hypothetical protein
MALSMGQQFRIMKTKMLMKKRQVTLMKAKKLGMRCILCKPLISRLNSKTNSRVREIPVRLMRKFK